ncbi:hypothetical protein [Bhargavaea cecembensis]|nr:hypothetical protein [Bhargavaea cecembensis]
MMQMPFCYMPVFDMCCPMCGHGHMHHHQMMQPYHHMHHHHMMQPYPEMMQYPGMMQYPEMMQYSEMEQSPEMMEYHEMEQSPEMMQYHEMEQSPEMPQMPTAPGYTLPMAEGMSEDESREQGWKMGESSSYSSSLDAYMGKQHEAESPMVHHHHMSHAPMHMYPAESPGGCGCGSGSGSGHAVPYSIQAAAWNYWPQPTMQPYPGYGHHHGHHHGQCCNVCGSPFGYGGY